MKNMKRMLFTAIVAVFASALSLQAQNYKFGHINSDEVMQQMPEYDSIISQLEAYRVELVNTLELMSVELNNKAEEYNNNYNNYTDVVRQVKEQELNDMNTRIQEFQNTASVNLQNKQNELSQPLYAKYEAAVKAVGEKNNFIYIFESTTLRYFNASNSVDVAPLVRTELGIK